MLSESQERMLIVLEKEKKKSKKNLINGVSDFADNWKNHK